MKNTSAYAMLGGSTPYGDAEMRKNVVEKHFGGADYEAFIMFESPTFKVIDDGLRSDIEWTNIYCSVSGQGYAKICKDKNIIKGSVLTHIGLVGAIYVKKGTIKKPKERYYKMVYWNKETKIYLEMPFENINKAYGWIYKFDYKPLEVKFVGWK